jgi:hypothetical protein
VYYVIALGCDTHVRLPNAIPEQVGARPEVIPNRYHGDMALTVRTDAELEKALSSLAESEGLSRQEVIRRAVLDRYERSSHTERVAESITRMTERWGDVLERLGSA